MPPVEEAALETKPAPVADVLPEAAKPGLPEGNLAAVADQFWTDEPVAPAKTEPKAEPVKNDEPAKKEEAAPKPASLAERFAAKAKPADKKPVVSADDATPEKAPEDDMELDHRASPAARENFKKLKGISRENRAKAVAAEKELASVRAQLETARKTPAAVDTEKLTRLETEHKAAMERLLVIDTQNHPAFREQYVGPREAALAEAQEVLKANGKDANLAALIERPRGEIGKALAELLKDVPPYDQIEINSKVHRAFELRTKERAALAQAGQINAGLRQQDAAAQGRHYDEVWNRLAGNITETLPALEVSANATAEERASVEAYNAAIAGLSASARQTATGTTSLDSIAEASIKAAAYDLHVKEVLPRLGREFSAAQEIIAQLTEELKGYRSRNPNRDFRATPAAAKEGKSDKTTTTIEEAAAAAWG